MGEEQFIRDIVNKPNRTCYHYGKRFAQGKLKVTLQIQDESQNSMEDESISDTIQDPNGYHYGKFISEEML